jgi:hypothetical protein
MKGVLSKKRVGVSETVSSPDVSEEPAFSGVPSGVGSQAPDTRVGVRSLNEIEKFWLAGVIDGEGFIILSKVTQGNWRYRGGFVYVASMSLSNSNEAFLRKVREITGKGSELLCRNREGLSDRWLSRCAGLVLRGLLPQLTPHLVIEKRNVEIMLQCLSFVDANPIEGSRRVIPTGYYEILDSVYVAIKKLNEKGKDAEPIEALLSQPSSLRHHRRGDGSTQCREMVDEESLAGRGDRWGRFDFRLESYSPRSQKGFLVQTPNHG